MSHNHVNLGDESELDRRIVQTMLERAGRVAPVGDPVPGVRASAARLRRRRAALTTLPAAAVAATIIAVAFAVSDHGDPAGLAADPTATATPEDPPVPSTPPPSTPSSAAPTFEDALRLQAATEPDVVQAMIGRAKPTGVLQCGIRVLGQGAGGTQVYAWLACGDYTTGSAATELTASSLPAVLSVSGAGPDVVVTAVEFPRQQHLDADTARMFPPAVAAEISAGQARTSPTSEQLLEHARTLP